MIYKLVAIKDRAIDAFQQVFCVRTQGEAIRAFQDALNKPESPMHNHSDDYDLYLIGNYDDATGEIEQDANYPQQIAIGKQLKL